jgi:hypothetical protein
VQNSLPSSKKEMISFLSFDVEALSGRSPAGIDPVDRLVWGVNETGQSAGLQRLCSILDEHKVKANFMVELGIGELHSIKSFTSIIDYLLSKGHDVHPHLHAEKLLPLWKTKFAYAGEIEHFDLINKGISRLLLEYCFYYFHKYTKIAPKVFRAGSFRYNLETISNLKSIGYLASSNFSSERINPKIVFNNSDLKNNECFYWQDGILEIPVDISPEPLDMKWQVIFGMFERARKRKKINTFNSVNHSWSLLNRSGEHMTTYNKNYEEGLIRLIEFTNQNSKITKYTDFINSASQLIIPTIDSESFLNI